MIQGYYSVARVLPMNVFPRRATEDSLDENFQEQQYVLRDSLETDPQGLPPEFHDRDALVGSGGKRVRVHQDACAETISGHGRAG
jgi:hypothetical protein